MSAWRNDLLKDLLMSRGLHSESVRAVEAEGRWRKFDPDEILLNSGQIARDLNIVVTGSVDVLARTRDGGHVILASIGCLDIVGWEALLNAQPTAFTFRAREATRLWRIPTAGLDRLCVVEPRAAIGLADMALSTMLRIQGETPSRLRGAKRSPTTLDGPCSLPSNRNGKR